MKRLALTLALGTALAGLAPAAGAATCQLTGCLRMVTPSCGGGSSDAMCPICIHPEEPISGRVCTP